MATDIGRFDEIIIKNRLTNLKILFLSTNTINIVLNDRFFNHVFEVT